ncbi:MAG: hypothetical protein JRI81_13535 [Deltaproteobacteria bacterium]|nr:hypothetical protein [Deltaproteobacteria bacterium]
MQREKDADPDSETPRTFGAARWSSGAWKNECAIYLEVIREAATLETGHVMAHECGHAGGAVDNGCEPGCLMWKDATGHIGDHFCGKCLKDFRKDSNW